MNSRTGHGVGAGAGRGGGAGRGSRQRNTLDGFVSRQATADDDAHRDLSLGGEADDVSNFRKQIVSQSEEVTADGCLRQAMAIAFTGDDADEMVVDSVEFSLICPYSKTRMTRPVSCVECNHIHCMDMSSAIRVLLTGRSMKNPRGSCPRCGRTVRLSQMYVNPWMESLLHRFPVNDQLVLTAGGVVTAKVAPAATNEREVFDCSTQDFFVNVVVKPEPGTMGAPVVKQYNPLAPSRSSSSDSPANNAHGQSAGPTTTLTSLLQHHQAQRQSEGGPLFRASDGFSDNGGLSRGEGGGSPLLDALPPPPQPLCAAGQGDDASEPPPLIPPPTNNLCSAPERPTVLLAGPASMGNGATEPASPAPMAVATFDFNGNGSYYGTSQQQQSVTQQQQQQQAGASPSTGSSFFSILPTLTVRRLNRGIIDRQWVPMCPRCGRQCTEQHDPDTGVLEEGCCGVTAPRSEWPLERVVGPIRLRLLPDDLLLVMGSASDCFGSKLLRACFYRADAFEGHYFGYIDGFGRYELDFLFALCFASANGNAACNAVSPVPELFREWMPRGGGSFRGGSFGGGWGGGMSQQPAYSQQPGSGSTPYAPAPMSSSYGGNY